MQIRMMCQFWNTVEVTILPPYLPSPEEQQSPVLFASNVRRLYSEHLGLPMVEQVNHSMHMDVPSTTFDGIKIGYACWHAILSTFLLHAQKCGLLIMMDLLDPAPVARALHAGVQSASPFIVSQVSKQHGYRKWTKCR